jgi:hypothetical protein
MANQVDWRVNEIACGRNPDAVGATWADAEKLLAQRQPSDIHNDLSKLVSPDLAQAQTSKGSTVMDGIQSVLAHAKDAGRKVAQGGKNASDALTEVVHTAKEKGLNAASNSPIVKAIKQKINEEADKFVDRSLVKAKTSATPYVVGGIGVAAILGFIMLKRKR